MNTKIIQIPEYTADDFLSSSQPYEFLYAHKDDKFMLQQLVQKMKERAGMVHVRSFMALWKSYCATVQRQNGVITDNATDFDGQEIELLSGEYRCDETGVYLPDKFGGEICVCCHPILPIRRLINADSGEERLEIAYKKGKRWRALIVEKSIIASSTQIVQLAAHGIVVTSENAKALSTYLLFLEQKNYENIPEQNSVGRLGWINEHGFSPYVQNLTFDGESNFRHMFNAVKSKGNRQKWIDAMTDLRGQRTVARIALAAAFASVIVDPCGILPFFVHFWGQSGTGKSVLLRVAASVWGDSRMGAYITTFNSTDVGQEMTATFLNSLPMCIDELQIQASSGIRDFDRMIYKLTEGIGRTRGAKTGGLRQTNTWRNCMITTGEFPILNANSMSGATVRVIETECTDKVYSDLVGLCAVINDNYGFAGREFVEYLQSDGAFDKVNALQKMYYRELLKSDTTDKQAASVAAILAADSIATALIFRDNNALTVEDVKKFMTKKEEANANSRALEYIYEFVGKNPNKFKPNSFGDYQSEAWGKIEGDYIYIIKSVFDKELAAAGYNSTAFLSWAKRNDLLDTNEGRRTKKARVGNAIINTICIAKGDEIFENVEEYDDNSPFGNN